MQSVLNIDEYFKRIDYKGPEVATLKVLRDLHLLHPKSIPFENLSPFLGIPVKLDVDSLQQKLVQDGRGGYCFEQNLLFKEVLEKVGFSVQGLAARILWNQSSGKISPRGHMLLLVQIDKKYYISDVGFGGLGPTTPLLLEPDITQQTPHENYQFKQHNNDFTLYSDVKGEWKPLYQFNLDRHYLEDYEITNWYLSNHPESHFVTGLIAARPDTDPARRYSLKGNRHSVHYFGVGTEKKRINSIDELKDILETRFRITLSDLPQLDNRLEQVIQ